MFNAASNHVILIVFENQRYTAIIGNAHAPYLNSLAAQYGVASNFFADTHPSIGNYFMLTTGQIITNDLDFAGSTNDNNIARVMGQAGMPWRAYLESIPRTGYTGDGPYPYAKTHNPFAYFSDIHVYPLQADNMVSFTQFAADLAADKLPPFVYIAPDQTHNMHDCPGGGRDCDNDTKVAAGDAWLQQQLQPVLNSESFLNNNTLVIITWDESWDNDSQGGGGHVPVILVGANVKPGFVSNQSYRHENVLALICKYLNLPNTLGNAAGAKPMDDFFQSASSQ
jgi:acid phosphatase